MYTPYSEIACDDVAVVDDEYVDDYEVELEDLMKKRPVECRCPKCSKKHILSIFWTGTGTPRMYCHQCREVITGISDNAIYEARPDAYRTSRGGNVVFE